MLATSGADLDIEDMVRPDSISLTDILSLRSILMKRPLLSFYFIHIHIDSMERLR